MKLILKGSIMVCLSLICGTINLNASDIEEIQDPAVPKEVEHMVDTPSFISADLLCDNKVIGHKILKMFLERGVAESKISNENAIDMDNPCLAPIELVRNKKGRTSVKFHRSDGSPAKEIIFPEEDKNTRLDVSIRKDKRAARIAEYDCTDDGMLKQRQINYYNACGAILYAKYTAYDDTRLSGLPYNMNSEILPTERCEIGTDKYPQVNDDSKTNIERVGLIAYSRYDKSAWLLISDANTWVLGRFPYVFAKGKTYACSLDNGEFGLRWSRNSLQYISCLNLQNGIYQEFPLNGNLKNLRVTDSGEVTVDYSNNMDKAIESSKIYSLRFQLNNNKAAGAIDKNEQGRD